MFEIGDLVKFGDPKLVAIKNREHPGKQLGIVMAVSREFFWTYESDKDDRIAALERRVEALESMLQERELSKGEEKEKGFEILPKEDWSEIVEKDEMIFCKNDWNWKWGYGFEIEKKCITKFKNRNSN